ncbi:LacI family DNA-binding transcriptional regulator [Streptomyces sp. SL13]|uniref:LacI family DNA-binding transcriptional regulator n=1 Tax=Streptantibioticus silvisoli TaxID=2705255 RepID=A0AA90H333_9ACTN|nr:LacI family DNA-binding transcriptional regulator [Streptantibioticus silvisoli]MDI5964883.1 LacI family DNA-binding transcriptional regulator [Streptantibioticus silvisoli]MDI5971121.1 LacI family DNA-binding transcriptional regulator [Streptantibioticus silvisoli]
MSAPTVYDVAEQADVSIATVSRVFRKPDAVREATRERVMAVARKLGYVPSGSARGLASRSTGVLGLCFPDYDDSTAGVDDGEITLYSDEIIRGMERAARRHGYALLIAASLAGGTESLVAKVAGRVDGFAVLARTVPTEELEIVSRRLPVVMLAGPREMDHLDHIEVANTDGQRQLTRHLIEDHGRTRLAFVGGAEDSPDAQARFHGFQLACQDAGLPVPDAPDARGDLTQADGRAATEALLARPGPAPEAILFANDQMAVGALRVLEHRGLRVPDDIAVTGFDGIPLTRLTRPPVTTVRQPAGRLGENAVDLLVQRLADPTRAPESVMLPVTVVRRESCGCGD